MGVGGAALGAWGAAFRQILRDGKSSDLRPLLGVGEDLLIGQGASTFRPHMSLALSTSFAWALAPISFQQVHPSQHRSRELVEVTL